MVVYFRITDLFCKIYNIFHRCVSHPVFHLSGHHWHSSILPGDLFRTICQSWTREDMENQPVNERFVFIGWPFITMLWWYDLIGWLIDCIMCNARRVKDRCLLSTSLSRHHRCDTVEKAETTTQYSITWYNMQGNWGLNSVLTEWIFDVHFVHYEVRTLHIHTPIGVLC